MAGKKHSGKRLEKHGLSKTREYRAWADMITRCTNPKFIKWKYYGGKGVKVCDEWRQSFVAFRAHMGECPPKHSLDRIDSSKGYEPGNCRWVTQANQMRNTCRTRMLTINGRTQCLSDWAIEYGLAFACLHKRLSLGWTIEKALSVPSGDGWLLEYNGKRQSIHQWAKETGINYTTITGRINKLGWSIEKALTTHSRNICRPHKPRRARPLEH